MNTGLGRRPSLWSGALASFTVVTLGTTLFAQAPTLTPGKYEKTSETSMPGRPARPAQKGTICLGADDVKDLSKVAGSLSDEKASCKVSDYAVANGTATFTRTCQMPSGSTLVFDVTMTFTSAESYRGTAKVRSSGMPGLLEGMTNTTTAKRIGTCSK